MFRKVSDLEYSLIFQKSYLAEVTGAHKIEVSGHQHYIKNNNNTVTFSKRNTHITLNLFRETGHT